MYSANGGQALPFRTINHLNEGDVIGYAPILRGREKRPGEVSLVMVPAKRDPKRDQLIITDPKPAEKPQRWRIPETISLVAFAYGPAGLSKKKVRGFLSQDDLLIAQLADYAEKTAQTEALVQALSNIDSTPASVNAALTGFASQYGFAVQLDRTAPPALQAETLFATMNPQLAAYNPIEPSPASRVGQTASLATVAGTLFFGSPIGLAAGGTAMLLDLRAIAFPGTEFRSSFAQPLQQSGLNLCGPRNPVPIHTRVAYLWANRIPNVAPPSIRFSRANYIPEGQKSPVPVEVPDAAWKYLDRGRDWTLVNDQNQSARVKVLKLANQRSIEIDVTKANLPPGDYHLRGFWDWTPFEAIGDVHVRALSDFQEAKLEPISQDRLIAKTGKVAVTLTGSDFEFITKIELKRMGDEFAIPEPVRFILPKGLRNGPQDQMDVQIDTSDLNAGDYALLISQQDGKEHRVGIKILPAVSSIDNFPIIANQGVAIQHYVLKGDYLNLLSRLEVSGAVLELGPATDQHERSVTIRLQSSPAPGTALPITAWVQDRVEPLNFERALLITGPLPSIASSKLSLPANMQIAINPGEFPAGYTLTALLDVKNLEPTSVLRIGCSSDVAPPMILHVGQQTDSFSLEQLSQDQLFLSLNTSAWPAGCSVTAVVDNGRDGKSQPYTLAHIIRLPQIESLKPTGQQSPNGLEIYQLTGLNLEMIGKAGWDQTNGTPATELPSPIPGQGRQELLQINLPEPPAPQAVLYIWMRGETTGRATTITSPPPIANPAPAPVSTLPAPPPPKAVQVPKPTAQTVTPTTSGNAPKRQ